MKKKQLVGTVLVTLLISFPLLGNSFAETLKGTVKVDGSSTVFPITEAVAEEFGKKHQRVRVTVGVSGTGGGFKKFFIGETDINDASRPIKGSEKKLAKKNGIEYIQLPVAFDGISVVVNPKNTWLDYLTVAELKKIWEPGSQVTTWKDVRAGWPDRKIRLYGPGTDSGTFDYFTGAINGKSHASRSDFTKSEDDNVLVQGVAGDRDALGYFGFAYYSENKDKLKIVPIKNKQAPVAPSLTTINDGSYSPLSRPIFIYVSGKSVQRPEVATFVEFYLKNAAELSRDVGYVSLQKSQYDEGLQKLNRAIVKDVL
jgi:phosphate transport system substrate-binding protein